MKFKSALWLAGLPAALSLMAAVPNACAELVFVSQTASVNAQVQDRSLNTLASDGRSLPAGSSGDASLSASASTTTHSAKAGVSSSLKADRLDASVSVGASFLQPDQTQTASASANLAVFFDVTKPTDLDFQFTSGQAGNSIPSMTFSSVNQGVETPVTLVSEVNGGGHLFASVPAGHYVMRGKGTMELGAWMWRSNQTLTWKADAGVTMTAKDTNPLAHGPFPDANFAEQAVGPLAVANTKIASPAGYGGATVYYPTTTSEGPFALVVITPGLMEKQSAINWLGPRLASFGFVVLTLDTKSPLDSASSRVAQTKAAITQVLALNANAQSPFAGRIDPARVGAMGHDNGGSLDLALALPQLLASIPMAPVLGSQRVASTTVPTMIVSCQRDLVAPVGSNANKAYDALSGTLPKALAEIKGGGHTCTNTSTSTANQQMIGKYTLSWLKRFLDKDTRYSAVLCEGAPQLDLVGSPTALSAYKSNCPY